MPCMDHVLNYFKYIWVYQAKQTGECSKGGAYDAPNKDI